MKYKLNRYSKLIKDEDYYILYNPLNGALLCFNKEPEKQYIVDIVNDVKSINDIEDEEFINTLSNYWFLIDENADEHKLAQANHLISTMDINSLSFTIFVTQDCNFKCIYCPQVHEPLYMSMNTLDNICSAIDKILLHKNIQSLIISWFGGEPLLNMDVITEGMRKLNKICTDHGTILSSNMTTNGYLLSKNVADELICCGVKEFQITIDGLPETHNKNRKTKNDGGTWDVIWNNLLKIKDISDDFKIMLRINVNFDNINESFEFLSLIKEQLNSKFIVRINPIVYMGGEIKENVSFCSTMDAQAIQFVLYDYLIEKQIETDIFIQQIAPLGFVCNASRINNYVINHDGTVHKCEVKLDNSLNRIGYISHDGHLIIDRIKEARFIVPNSTEYCTNCEMYALCLGLCCPIKDLKTEQCINRQYLLDEHIKNVAHYYMNKNRVLK